MMHSEVLGLAEPVPNPLLNRLLVDKWVEEVSLGTRGKRWGETLE